MQMTDTKIGQVKLITLNPLSDTRGAFVKIYHEGAYGEKGIAFDLKEQYYSVSQKNVIRGMHFQEPPFDCAKLVTVLSGSVVDVVLDIRKQSPTFAQWEVFSLDGRQPQALYIPKGCAHGFLSLEDDTCMLYNVSQVYNRDCDTGIRWDSFGYQWEVEHPVISDRDRGFAAMEEYMSPF